MIVDLHLHLSIVAFGVEPPSFSLQEAGQEETGKNQRCTCYQHVGPHPHFWLCFSCFFWRIQQYETMQKVGSTCNLRGTVFVLTNNKGTQTYTYLASLKLPNWWESYAWRESLTRTSIVRWRKKHLSSKTSLQITNILDRGPDSTKNLNFPKVIFFKKRRFPSPKLDPPDPNGHIPCIQMAQGPDSQRRWRASFETWYSREFLPCRFVDFFDFWPEKKKQPYIFYL